MCLTTITSIETENVEGQGWKIVYPGECVSENENEFWSEFRFLNHGAMPYNTWIERKGNVINSPVGRYPAGFHIFTTKEDAENYQRHSPFRFTIIVKVKYKIILAKGNQTADPLAPPIELPCIVTQFLYVEKPNKNLKENMNDFSCVA